jgi:hypothetical protein
VNKILVNEFQKLRTVKVGQEVEGWPQNDITWRSQQRSIFPESIAVSVSCLRDYHSPWLHPHHWSFYQSIYRHREPYSD